VMGRLGRRRKQLLNDLKQNSKYCKLKKRNTIFHSVGNSLWKRLWICRKADYGINE
jgi:hypothetical protein